MKYIPRTPQELNNIRNLVLRAAGLNEERGDKIEVLNMPFEVENIPEEKSVFGIADNKELVLNLGRYVFYLIIALSVFFFVLRPFFKVFQRREEALPLQKVKDVYLKAGAMQTAAIPAGDQAQPAIAEAFKDKALVGSIIREWVKENA